MTDTPKPVKACRMGGEAVKTIKYDLELARDLVVFVDRLGEACGYEPVAELRLTHEVVREMLALCARMNTQPGPVAIG